MSATPDEIDLSHITAEQFATLVAGSDDELILRTVRETGTRAVLDRVLGEGRQGGHPDPVSGHRRGR
jgi:hypothetical protein